VGSDFTTSAAARHAERLPDVCLQDLLLAANDQPFRFPATFTFVVRSFTVLDGIGKSLDPRFDISEIAAPYARNLLLEGQPQVCAPVGCVALAQHVCSLLGLL
jgi:predicted unusual protein kinase regulating ubiquinone biosynthesis (AarF/ABC1/UbiB family)